MIEKLNVRTNLLNPKIYSMKLLSILALFFYLNSNVYAQIQKDLVTITGRVSDYNGNPVDNCSVMFQNSNFDVLYETKTDEKGKYQIDIPKGKYSNISAINMDTYPHTMKHGTKNEDLRLEFWGWNFIADRDTTLNIQYNRMEAYGLHVFQVPGGVPAYQIYVRPMSLTRFLTNKGIQNAQHKEDLSNIAQMSSADTAKCDNIAPAIDKAGIKVWIDGEEVDVLMKQQIKEYYEATEYGIAYYITVNRPEKSTTLPYKIFKIELTDLENGDKGEAIYYLEKTNYIEQK